MLIFEVLHVTYFFSQCSVLNLWNGVPWYRSLSFTVLRTWADSFTIRLFLYYLLGNLLPSIFFPPSLGQWQRPYFLEKSFPYLFFSWCLFSSFPTPYFLGDLFDSIFQIFHSIFHFCSHIFKFSEFFSVLCSLCCCCCNILFIHGCNNLTSLIFLRILVIIFFQRFFWLLKFLCSFQVFKSAYGVPGWLSC